MRVLVTGATGYIGSRIIPVLLDHGHYVIAAARNPTRSHDSPGPIASNRFITTRVTPPVPTELLPVSMPCSTWCIR